MHIKHITISNFRSFRDQTQIEAFSPALNSVVGRNGSGKSNLFDAVQFCLLAPRFANLRQEERQALLHEGSGSAAVNAYVEIVFDNSDHRFTLEQSDEVVLRRTIGVHKDEFFLQSKRTTKSEIQSLLESAGFSKSNPYFIVQQGKIQDLCTMSDADRLKWLQEVAGTVLYDEKKQESTRKMAENASSREKIDGMLQDMDAKLEELESERDELTQYTELDKRRRAVEYSLYDAEHRKAIQWFQALEDERANHFEHLKELHEKAKSTHDAIRHAEATLKAVSHQAKRNRNNLQVIIQDYKEASVQSTQLQGQVREYQEALSSTTEQLEKNKKELVRIEAEMTRVRAELKEKQAIFDQASEKLMVLKDRREQAGIEVEALYAKQGRGRQYETKEERDSFLKTTLSDLETARAEKQAELEQSRDTLANLRRIVEQETQQINQLKKEIQTGSANLQQVTKSIEEKKSQKLQAHDARKEEYRKLEELHDVVREAREKHKQAVFDTRKTMPKATALGIEALSSIVEQEGLVQGKHYFGSLMSNFTLQHSKYKTAVEIAAGNSLFHVIVDTDDTASRLMKRLESQKLGRVTFLPLNRLRVDDLVKVPDGNSDIRSMLDLCIQYDATVKVAMQHVFGKKLLARTTDVAAEWSKKLQADAITLDGDLCSRKGALTGGYVDANKSRLSAYQNQEEAKTALLEAERLYHESETNAKLADQAATSVVQELQKLEAKHGELLHMLDSKENNLERMQARLVQRQKQTHSAETALIPEIERSLVKLDADMKRIEDEMGTELTKSLSEAERERLNELKQLQTDLLNEIEDQNERVLHASTERQKLESLLHDNLMQRHKEISESSGIDDNDGPDFLSPRKSRVFSSTDIQEHRLAESRRQLEVQTKILEDLEARLTEARALDEKFGAEILVAKNELEQQKSQDAKNVEALSAAQDKSERLLNKRCMTISKRDMYARKIQELGSLPKKSELDKVSGKSIQDLMRILEGINKELKKYSHVNKKAFDQYVNFNEQRDQLLKRKEELDQGAEKVKELIESLDRQKDEAINRTFRGVRKHFKEVFKALVPDGAGELIMRTEMDEKVAEIDDDSSDDEENAKSVDKANPDISLYRGIGIKVKFAKVGENYIMSQLSGGQKALVALALIFAIQRCDPAPFYLFDELDQALDSSYRASVANLIKKQAVDKENPAQFIVSTFRPELVAAANAWFGISHQNKVSNLHSLTRSDSLHFIANLMEEEAVGDVTTGNTSKISRATRESRKRKSIENDAEEEENNDASA
ncbi:structural maintenance of chromosome 3 [Fistulifera solaris]|uniref:Structural maintenance of chromosomes protein n=1 Tax=Fistulifera solaris TaxID=1519565 RepID=A0A1Z5JPU3_FISSO|nr:structural maintenance of chromosome 3 [Fistulifera solaris]|eukprot:GAX16037.1 structural maintenance of chromosome 3 [Fistulifera solaris]